MVEDGRWNLTRGQRVAGRWLARKDRQNLARDGERTPKDGRRGTSKSGQRRANSRLKMA